MHNKYDLIAIGDTVIDAFIKLHDATVSCDINHHKCQLCMSFADKVPYESLEIVAGVGNSSNVAVGIARLGFRSAILTAVGDDYYGKQILDVYDNEGVGKDLVNINKGIPTNYHFVLNFQAERTILVKHQDFQYKDISSIDDVEWVYLSSLGSNTEELHRQIGLYLNEHPKIKLGFNPGTFQMKMGLEKLTNIYRNTFVLFINKEEAQRILNTEEEDIIKLFAGVHTLGPKNVLITDGPEGAYASDGQNFYFMSSYPDPKPPISRTGAGDAFSTGIMGALMSGLTLEQALTWAPIESMSVVQQVGAQKGLLTKPQLLSYLAKAPADYKPRRL
jgi:sugar/nucleoside kinase (ribokinase family)